MNINELPSHRGFILPWTKASSRSLSICIAKQLFVQTAGRADIDDAKAAARLPFLKLLPTGSRGHVVAVLGEFIGTFLFLFFAFAGTQIANTTNTSGTLTTTADISRVLYISLVFGFSLVVNAWTFFRISGGLFNPAVTLGMCLIGALTWTRAGLLFVTQMIAALVSGAIVSALFPGDLAVQTTLSAGTNIAQGLFIEMFLTFQLVFTIFMLAAEKHKATFIAPVGIGLSLFVAELAGVFFTGGSLNPARSFAPCVVQRAFSNYHWIYWLGPILGTLLATLIYRTIKMLEYETANPDQDDDGEEKAVVTPEVVAAMSSGSSPAQSRQGRSVTNKSVSPQAGGTGHGYDAGPYMEASGAKRDARPD